MQRWEAPLMEAMAKEVMRDGGHILEVGFGMAISATMVMSLGPASYTVIEAHPDVAGRAREWADRQTRPARVIEGFFQDITADMEERYDGILFDPYPITEAEWWDFHMTFAPEGWKRIWAFFGQHLANDAS
jgi:guanidinoacetate N-methyltransferase